MATPRQAAGPRPADATTLAFLALYLIVLAFFLMLTAIATPSPERARAAVGSLADTFRGIAEVEIGVRPESGGDALAGRFGDFADGLRRLIETAMPLAVVVPEGRGETMRMTLASEALFAPGAGAPRPEARPFLERLAALLATPRPSGRIVAEALVADPGGADRALAIARAAGLVEALAALGAPPTGLSAGLAEAGAPIALVFRLVPPDGPESAP